MISMGDKEPRRYLRICPKCRRNEYMAVADKVCSGCQTVKKKTANKHCRFCSKSEDRNLCEAYMLCLAAVETTIDPVADFNRLLDVGHMAGFCKDFDKR